MRLPISPMKSSPEKHKRSQDLLTFLPILFRSVDAGKLTSSPQIFLNRAVKRGDIARLIRGYYVNTWKGRITGEQPTIEQIACFLRRPSYISGEWAMNAHSLIDQAPTVCTVITLAPSVGQRNRVMLGATAIEYSRIKEELFWGYEFANGAYLASPEKAILDTIYLRGKLPVADEINWDFVNVKKLKKSAEHYPLSVRKYLRELIEIPARTTPVKSGPT